MLPTTCPICGKILRPKSNAVLYCEECGITWDLAHMKVSIDEDAPDNIQESYTLLKEITSGKVTMSYGKHNLFEPEFRRNSTTVINSGSGIDWPPLYKDDVLISYNTFVTRYLVHDLPYLMEQERFDDFPNNVSAAEKLSVTDVDLAMITEFMAQVVPAPEMTHELDKALVALTAPTWAHTLRVLVNDFDYHWNDLSVSQKSLFLLTCNKLQLVTSLIPERVCADLQESIIEAAFYCSIDVLSNHIDKSHMTEYVQQLPDNKFHTLVEQARSSIPEVSVVSGNNWLLMQHTTIFDKSPLFFHVNNDKEYKANLHVGNFMQSAYSLWKTYTSPLLPKEFEKAKELTVGMSPTALYMTYWNLAVERLNI